MLDFFRRHQRYFFVLITIVIVISFSFFGTYSSLSNSSFREQIAFTNVNGTDVTRHELEEMVVFLGTDSADKLLFGGAWGPNFLNDGVIKKDFLETGLGTMLALDYADDVAYDLKNQLEKERRFTLYSHPQAKFIGTEAAWNYFAPDMTLHFQKMRATVNPVAPDALESRVALFLMERQLPSPLLRQVMRYQEKQYSWVTPDRNLDHLDLSLFGYHTLEDWFGPRFVRLVSEFVMNAALIAKEKGYQVSKEDALADLRRNAEISYQQNAQNPAIGVANSHEYFNEQLRRLGMDQGTAVKVWQQVMLFRRMFQDMGSSVFVDSNTLENFDAYAMASATGELYQLPKDLRLANYRAMQKFEVYLDAIAKRSEEDKAKLKLPITFLTTAEIAQKSPELVEKKYVLEVAQINKKALESNISVKDTWAWESDAKNWDVIAKQFPELAAKTAKTPAERMAILDGIEEKTRARIDSFARAAIVDAHPEWINQALAEAQSRRMDVGLHEKGLNPQFAGLENGQSLMQLLDAAPLNQQEATTNAAKEAKAALAKFSADKNTYYRIQVIERLPQAQVLTFGEANKQGLLDRLLDRTLDTYYEKVRDQHAKEFQRDDKTWRPFADIKDKVADLYFEPVLNGIRTSYAAAIAPEVAPQQMIGDYAATLRLYSYVKEMKDKMKANPSLVATLTTQVGANQANSGVLAEKTKLSDQWKMEKSSFTITRSSPEQLMDKTELFSLAAGAWTKVNTPANGDLNFFNLKELGKEAGGKTLVDNISKARTLLGDDAQQRLMGSILKQIKAQDAISLSFMNKTSE